MENTETVSFVIARVEKMEGMRNLRAALPKPFLIDIKDRRQIEVDNYSASMTYIDIYIQDKDEKIDIFYGWHYGPSQQGEGFCENCEWAKEALAPFFAALPDIYAQADKNFRFIAPEEMALREKQRVDRAREIYLKHHLSG